mmetsp:Transcript_4312/g.6390  ORF Transcript_4312/g.6390 Transcript_4312/m.6390 type:complete len:106 (+) Transcript_4312:213-530(+)
MLTLLRSNSAQRHFKRKLRRTFIGRSWLALLKFTLFGQDQGRRACARTATKNRNVIMRIFGMFGGVLFEPTCTTKFAESFFGLGLFETGGGKFSICSPNKSRSRT